ncbi:uncharacterized protein LOC143145123 isoform X1 [Ptiloglossa arizonensis]|uniref:uncharacterized protein LOC143145123 isoform X1 n=1 Tax=Ptiloglossa arizonensis TaxID=3350558 RepID=UPI003FA037E0
MHVRRTSPTRFTEVRDLWKSLNRRAPGTLLNLSLADEMQMRVSRREGRRIVWIRCPMLLALGLLLVLSDAGALHQESNVLPYKNSSFEFTRTNHGHGISVTRILQDGELERVVRWHGICAKETVVNWGDTDVALRQVWLQEIGRKLHLIYEGGTLTDCVDEKLTDGDERSCSSSAHTDDYDVQASIEVFEVDDNEKDAPRIPRDLSWLTSASELRHRCAHVRTRARNQVIAQHRRRKYAKFLNATNTSRKQRRGKSRSRRDLLMIPGTQWCGRGHRATKYTNLGGFGTADACCRRHDTACPFFVPAFETRYGIFNWGISSMMHCACDERFRTCLKMAGTASANFIGKIFFDVLRTKCFVLKPQKVCSKWSWMGKCQRHEYRKQGHVRDNVPY